MRQGMRNRCKLKVRLYTDSLIDINENLAAFPGKNSSNNLGDKNGAKYFWTVWKMDGVSKRMCRVFIVNILLKKTVNIYERMEMSETVYEGVVEPS